MLMKRGAKGDSERALVSILGLTFKENVPDVRNSKVVDIIRELEGFGVEVQVHDPIADREEACNGYGIELTPRNRLRPADAVILAVPHKCFVEEGWPLQTSLLKSGAGAVLDIKAKLPRGSCPMDVELWRL
jgi:UDP-N-acetyl-D-galactosamine dehydrogenase